jgi:hypothetical protein
MIPKNTSTKLSQLIQLLPYLLGIGLILVGLIGFLPHGHDILGIPAHQITYQHNFIHLLTGIGLIYVTYAKSRFRRLYVNLMGLLYLLLVIFGIGLSGNILNIVFVEWLDNVLHFGIAVLCFWFGCDNSDVRSSV